MLVDFWLSQVHGAFQKEWTCCAHSQQQQQCTECKSTLKTFVRLCVRKHWLRCQVMKHEKDQVLERGWRKACAWSALQWMQLGCATCTLQKQSLSPRCRVQFQHHNGKHRVTHTASDTHEQWIRPGDKETAPPVRLHWIWAGKGCPFQCLQPIV